jgi:thymidylate synthase
MKQYLDALQYVLDNGQEVNDRTGVGTLSCFGMQQRHDLSKSFPAITTKKLAWKACVGELLWFIEGSGNERRLAEITHGTAEGNYLDSKCASTLLETQSQVRWRLRSCIRCTVAPLASCKRSQSWQY